MPARATYAAEDDVRRFEDMRRLYIRARAHSQTKQKEGIENRLIEAFLLQTAILEGVLVNLEERLEKLRKYQFKLCLQNLFNN